MAITATLATLALAACAGGGARSDSETAYKDHDYTASAAPSKDTEKSAETRTDGWYPNKLPPIEQTRSLTEMANTDNQIESLPIEDRVVLSIYLARESDRTINIHPGLDEGDSDATGASEEATIMFYDSYEADAIKAAVYDPRIYAGAVYTPVDESGTSELRPAYRKTLDALKEGVNLYGTCDVQLATPMHQIETVGYTAMYGDTKIDVIGKKLDALTLGVQQYTSVDDDPDATCKGEVIYYQYNRVVIDPSEENRQLLAEATSDSSYLDKTKMIIAYVNAGVDTDY